MKLLALCLLWPVISLAGSPGSPLTKEDWAQIENFQKWSNKPIFRLVFRGADVNRDKYISIPEIRDFAAVELASRDTSENEPALRMMFKQNPRSDLNRDGVLTKRELLTYLDWFIESQ